MDEQTAATTGEGDEEPRRGLAQRLESMADAYGLVLALLVGMIIAPALVPGAKAARLVTALLGVTAIIVALASSKIKHWALIVTIIAAGAAFLLVASARSDYTLPAVIGSGILSVLFFVTSVGMLVRIARHKSITVRTLYGAIAAYLMIGLGFALLYQAIEFANADAISGTDLTQRGVHAYYSFTTLTTLGYGDIVPVSIGARTAAMFEMLLGQVYLVVIVARIVSMLGSERDIDEQVRSRIRDALRTAGPATTAETTGDDGDADVDG